MARRLLAVVALVFGAMTFNVGAASATTGPSPAATLPSPALLADVIAHASATPRGGSVSADAITPETATTTYQLVPAKNVIQVTVDLRLENHEKSTTSYYTCVQYYIDPWYGLVPYDATCSRTTSYYLNSTTAWTENSVTNLKVTADKGTVTKSVAKKQDGYTLWKLGFSNLFNGQVRKIHMTYSIAGGKPRSASTTRAGQAYAHFCATGNGIDGGTVNVIMPSGYVSSASSDQGTVTSSSGGGRTIYASGMQSDPADYYMCVDGTNEAAYHRATVTTPEGRSVTIEAWPEDSTWLTSVQTQASDAAAALERLIGQALPGTGNLTIREVAADQLGDYSGTFDSTNSIADVSETLDQGTVAHELSHDWFNDTLFSDRWLAEGSAGWAESATTPSESACAAPGPYPGVGDPHLLTWQFLGPKATATEEAVVGYQYDASCYIVSMAAQAMGPARMRDVLAYLTARKVPYLPEAAAGSKGQVVTWQHWLDTVDEVGVAPAGADLNQMQKLLATYGIAGDLPQLALRSQARQAYHEFETAAPSWTVPTFVRQALSDWRFSDAIPELAAGSELLTVAKDTDAALPAADAVSGTDSVAYEHAASLADLKAAVADAQELKASAKTVAAAVATSQRPLGFLDGIGLIGTNIAAIRTSAIDAVHAGKSATANSQAALLTTDLQQASSNGALRVGVVVLVVVLLLLLIGIYLLFRRRRRAVPVLAIAATADAGSAPGEVSVEAAVLEAEMSPIVETNLSADPAVDSVNGRAASPDPYVPPA